MADMSHAVQLKQQDDIDVLEMFAALEEATSARKVASEAVAACEEAEAEEDAYNVHTDEEFVKKIKLKLKKITDEYGSSSTFATVYDELVDDTENLCEVFRKIAANMKKMKEMQRQNCKTMERNARIVELMANLRLAAANDRLVEMSRKCLERNYSRLAEMDAMLSSNTMKDGTPMTPAFRAALAKRRGHLASSIGAPALAPAAERRCANPGCEATTGLRKCTGSCGGAVRYCSFACQTADWAEHRVICQLLLI